MRNKSGTYFAKDDSSGNSEDALSKKEKKRLKKNSILFGATSALLGIAASAASVFIPPLAVLAGCYVVLTVIEQWKSLDPPQLDYKSSIFAKKLKLKTIKQYPKHWQLLINSTLDLAYSSEAHLDCIEKLQGAKLRGDENYSIKLEKKCESLKRSYVNNYYRYSRKLEIFIQHPKISNKELEVSPTQFLVSRKNLVEKGLPEPFHQSLFEAGFDRMTIDYVYHRMTANRSRPKQTLTLKSILQETSKIQLPT